MPAQVGLIDEVGNGSASVTTARFNNVVYSLYSAGLYAASHQSWLLSNKAANMTDLIVIFHKTNPLTVTPYDYIFIVIPIFEGGDLNDPTYLSGLAGVITTPTDGFSLSSCMPIVDSQFAYYATCLTATAKEGFIVASTPATPTSIATAANPGSTVNGIVFLSLEGINVTAGTMNAVRNGILPGKAVIAIDSPVNPDANLISFIQKPGTALSQADIVRYVMTTNVLLDKTAGAPLSIKNNGLRKDTQASYTCVQFDPDKDINHDGTISVDASGQIMSEVMLNRQIVRNTMNNLGNQSNAPNDLVAYMVGSVLGLLFLFCAGMALWKWSVPTAFAITAAPGTTGTPTTLNSFFSVYGGTMMIMLVSIIIGAILGVLIVLKGSLKVAATTETNIAAAVQAANPN
jgi:hypothetical protein